MSQLPADCLNEIVEYLEEDNITLYSCLLVNRLWCKVSVRILWRNIQNCRTIIACLPNESKYILHKNKIIISTSKPPLFNYVTFIKNLSIYNINNLIKNILQNFQSITPQSLYYKKYIVAIEIYKLFMNQTTLRELYLNLYGMINTSIITFISYPGAKDCLKHLSSLYCCSNIYPEFFYQLSQLCHNIQYLTISFDKIISNGLKDLISVQKNLKYLKMYGYFREDLTNIIQSLTKLPNTLIKYELHGGLHYIPLSFIAKYTNLRKLVLSFNNNSISFNYFEKLQYITFTQLEILKFPFGYPKVELLTKFLENNGKNLKEFHICCSDSSLCLAVAKFCPNLKKFFSTGYIELGLLKKIFIGCQYLESINIWCNDNCKDVWDIIANYSPGNFYKLTLYYATNTKSEILSGELEKFCINWKKRTPQKSLSFIIESYNLKTTNEIMKVIDKHKKLGTVKEFEIIC
ncbi:hypothetical protein RhiirA5_496835 [Rhizophagus irregularis]|uniref:Uncharacterized protein n=1 Tax=Rhizophagus irregularis TaxID=588596 RepID=A0A2I1E7W7_9GLOM|nr:hypothetical protein RhiirA5_496835 [Rhizophagus irregularis]PKY18220.1 hypothetical protein RhiirB3_522595 [Rhizophagus irregularis]